MNTTRYATIDEALQMEFGVTGDTQTFAEDRGACEYERLISEEAFCWACKYLDDKGEMIDWDMVPEDFARELGLIK